MTQQIGGAIGLAVATAVMASQTRGADPVSLTNGFRSALVVSAGIALAAIVAAAVTLPRTWRSVRVGAAIATAH
jgi:hypothetical protein